MYVILEYFYLDRHFRFALGCVVFVVPCKQFYSKCLSLSRCHFENCALAWVSGSTTVSILEKASARSSFPPPLRINSPSWHDQPSFLTLFRLLGWLVLLVVPCAHQIHPLNTAVQGFKGYYRRVHTYINAFEHIINSFGTLLSCTDDDCVDLLGSAIDSTVLEPR